MLHIKFPYDVDPTGEGFFCPVMVQKRNDYFALKLLKPAEAEAVYQCRPGAKIGSIFVEADFRYFDAPLGLELGRRHHTIAKWIDSSGMMIAQGWDTAMSASSTADWSVCVTIGMIPCEHFHREADAAILPECDPHYDVYVLHVYRAKLEIGDLALAVKEQALLWNPEKIIIEKKASGTSVMQALANSGLPIEGVVPEENKAQRAINGGAGAGSTQGWFRSGRVLFPKLPEPMTVPWLEKFTQELKDFTGEKGGRDDQVDALVHVCNYAIREGTSGVQFPTGWQSVAQVDANMMAPDNVGLQAGLHSAFRQLSPLDDPDALMTEALIIDPFADTCGRCKLFGPGQHCRKHDKPTTALSHACYAFDDGTIMASFPRF